jgi:hypothetical protein
MEMIIILVMEFRIKTLKCGLFLRTSMRWDSRLKALEIKREGHSYKL